MRSVKINNKDLYTEFGFYLTKKTIEAPKLRVNTVNVPLRDGVVDMTKMLTDMPVYGNRKITIELLAFTNDVVKAVSDISNYCHGKTADIIFSDDASFVYKGIVTVEKPKTVTHGVKLTLTIDADPYKYDIQSSAVDWEWDLLDFEDGIINETGNLIISTEREITLICRNMRVFPEFNVSAPMQLVYDDVTYNLKKGKQKLYRLFFKEGQNKMKFVGNGTVSIDYIGGKL